MNTYTQEQLTAKETTKAKLQQICREFEIEFKEKDNKTSLIESILAYQEMISISKAQELATTESQVEPEVIEEVTEVEAETEAVEVTEIEAQASSEVEATRDDLLIYTTAENSFDGFSIRCKKTLELKTSNGESWRVVTLLDESTQSDCDWQLEQYHANGYAAFRREQWLELISDKEIVDNILDAEVPQKNIFHDLSNNLTIWAKGKTKKAQPKEKGEPKQRRRVTPDTIAALSEVVAAEGVEAAALQFDKPVTYVKRANRGYTELYLKSELIRDLYDQGLISWAAIHKLAGSNPDKIGLATIESKALNLLSETQRDQFLGARTVSA